MKVAIMGYGTIGSGVAEVLRVNQDQLRKKVGEPVTLKYVLDIRDSIPEDSDKLINDFSIIENDEEISLVVETMGGIHPAYEFVKACLEKGKHVVIFLYKERIEIFFLEGKTQRNGIAITNRKIQNCIRPCFFDSKKKLFNASLNLKNLLWRQTGISCSFFYLIVAIC